MDDLPCCGCDWPYIALAGAAASVKVCSVIGCGRKSSTRPVTSETLTTLPPKSQSDAPTVPDRVGAYL